MSIFLSKSIQEKCGYLDKYEYKCAFWDFNLNNGNGNWSTFGCTLIINNSMFTCSCNHTTNFAVLIVTVKSEM